MLITGESFHRPTDLVTFCGTLKTKPGISNLQISCSRQENASQKILTSSSWNLCMLLYYYIWLKGLCRLTKLSIWRWDHPGVSGWVLYKSLVRVLQGNTTNRRDTCIYMGEEGGRDLKELAHATAGLANRKSVTAGWKFR